MQIFKDSATAISLTTKQRLRFFNYTESPEVKRIKALLWEMKVKYEGPVFVGDEIVDITIKIPKKTVIIDVPSKDRRARAKERQDYFKDFKGYVYYPVLSFALNKCSDEKVKSDLMEILK